MVEATGRRFDPDMAFDIVNHALLIATFVIFVYPMFFVIIASISDPGAVWRGEVWILPKGVSFGGYKRILENGDIWTGYRNSLLYVVVGTSINLVMTITAAYPLSRHDFLPRSFLMKLYAFTMFFTGGLIPLYLLVKNLGMLNTLSAMVLPNAVAFWNIVIARTYFGTVIPKELHESASMDGCTDFRFLLQVVLPLSAPIVAVLALFYGVEHWNTFFNGLIFLRDRSRFPLQLILRDILLQSEVSDMLTGDPKAMEERMRQAETIKYGVIIIASVPVMFIYPLVQRHFVKGIMIGSLKG